MLRYLALLALLLVTPAAAQDHVFPTPGNATVPGYVTMCIVANQAVPCAASGGSIAAGVAITGCPAQANLFVTSGLLLGCVAALSESDTGSTLTSTGNLLMPDTASAGAAGVILFGGARFLHDQNANSNVFLGHNAYNFAGTPTQSVCVGESCMLSATGGVGNTCVGRFCMGGVMSGTANSALGNGAMSGITSGGSNVGVGSGTGGITSGSNNTFVGAGAGTAITTTSGNTILGQGCAGVVGDASTVRVGNVGCAAFMDFGVTTAATWSFTGALAATLASAIGTNAVCNTPGTKTALTVQVWATGCAASSARFKEGIVSLERDQALSDVLQFQPVSYTYRPEFNMGAERHVGFTAEQIGSVDPQWITYETDGVTPHAVKYNEMVPLLVAAIQELNAKFEAYKLAHP
jgi:hypothetical protein